MGACKTVLIVDDHPLFREGLRSLIARDGRYKAIGEAGSGADALTFVKQERPDIVLVDISLPDRNGIEVTREITDLSPDVRVVIISMHSKIDYIAGAFQAGAAGYVLKESAGDKLVQALDTVSRGDYFLDSSLSQNIVKGLMGLPKIESRICDKSYGSLTAREQQVLRMLAEGFSTKAIASSLCLSPKTVENHRANIMDKLNLHSTIELVRYAAKLGLIDIDLWKNS